VASFFDSARPHLHHATVGSLTQQRGSQNQRESRALFLTPSATGMRLDGAGIRIKLRRSQNKEKSANKTNSYEKKFEQRTIDKQFHY